MERIEEFRGRYWFLSNFYPHVIVGARGLRYPTAEAAFHGGKTDDPAERTRIAGAPTPQAAKRLGRALALRPDWNQHRHVVMRAVLRQKFADPNLAAKLMATGAAELVENTTWHDNEWGDCRCGRPTCTEPGLNWLGRYLMEVRAEISGQ